MSDEDIEAEQKKLQGKLMTSKQKIQSKKQGKQSENYSKNVLQYYTVYVGACTLIEIFCENTITAL